MRFWQSFMSLFLPWDGNEEATRLGQDWHNISSTKDDDAKGETKAIEE
eukprot:CAMPEP_0184666916 /NCGR_PEP_ID=MMETSP0308-20130426/64532_1 /TAXON_ID=38269 /ORGANISM="Gloeochaete witrockiana, Strain SAG 46.84" /LENGTH=47 /DNA_ID= /DNA_START= /DNA_END= /DNA_ORIENTATION=